MEGEDQIGGVRPVDAAQVRLLYQALLDRDPDPSGLAEWVGRVTFDKVVEAIKGSDEYSSKIQLAASLDSASRGMQESALTRDAAMVILRSKGTAAVPFEAIQLSPIDLFGTFPWRSVGGVSGHFSLRIMGPWAKRMQNEFARRFPDLRLRCGLPRRGCGRQDILVLTDRLYLFGLSSYWSEIVMGTKFRIVAPVASGFEPQSTQFRHAEGIRRRMHSHSFIEVTSTFRRHPDVDVDVETTQLTPVPGEFRRIRHISLGPVETPHVLWMIGNRMPREDR